MDPLTPEGGRVADRRDDGTPVPPDPAPMAQVQDGGTAGPAPTIGERLRSLWCSFVSGLG